MNLTRTILAAALTIAALAPSAPGGVPEFAEDQVIARFEIGADAEAIILGLGLVPLETIAELNAWLIGVPALTPEPVAVALLEATEGVSYAELNFRHFAPGGSTQGFFVTALEGDFVDQWTWRSLDLPGAHARATGAGTTVAVLDTGVDAQHPVVAHHVNAHGYDFIDDDADPSEENPGADDDADGLTDELYGHGTFLAGIIAEISPGTSIMAIRVLDSEGRGDAFGVTKGVILAAQARVDVINLSLGTVASSMLLADGIGAACDAGAIVVAATGNQGTTEPEYPSAHPDTIGVAAVDESDLKPLFSSYGRHVTICAPGVDVVSCVPGGGYGRADGTSISCAVVAGCLALAKSGPPVMSDVAVPLRMLLTARPLDGLNPKYAGGLGFGRIRLDRMLNPAAPLRTPLRRGPN